MKLGQLEINLDELTHFIVKAKQNGYAGNGEERREADGSKTLTFQEGNFHYTDNYAGSWQAPGTETVRWQREDGQRIWQMAYSGGMLPKFFGDEQLKKETFDFLREALSHVSIRFPLRGPAVYESPRFLYTMQAGGNNIKLFSGGEGIYDIKGHREVFHQDFIGFSFVSSGDIAGYGVHGEVRELRTERIRGVEIFLRRFDIANVPFNGTLLNIETDFLRRKQNSGFNFFERIRTISNDSIRIGELEMPTRVKRI